MEKRAAAVCHAKNTQMQLEKSSLCPTGNILVDAFALSISSIRKFIRKAKCICSWTSSPSSVQ
eukprot:2842473-Pyramimonas_sp.AAC.1